jgi:outer membrane protein assembly factor BamE (lipoprotein component of BamABCDE complex)
MARCAVPAAVALLVLAGVAAARSALVTHGPITPNVGASGITLGMTRAQVIAKLGKPVAQNLNG